MTDRTVSSNRVIATAGHVDHGKSSLIRRLTGIDPDRLEEEKRRGLTIELGYAWLTLPSGHEVGFVDVPGHERFVRTMLAGVGPVRLVLFVVAADEGWKPQSEEHLAIVDVLGVDGAVIALTKRDAVDPTRLAETEGEVRRRVSATALADAPIVACSAATGDGMPELVDALDAMVAVAPPPPDTGRPRLFVDRVFPIAGAGTVVTGTLAGGRLSLGDPIEIAPEGMSGRIRGLQSHERLVETATPVARVAVNVAGVDRSRIARGDVVAAPGTWLTTDLVEAHVVPVRALAHPLGGRGDFTFHAATAEREAKVRVLDGDRIPDEGAFVRIRLGAAVALEVGDRFVLRETGRHETVAGGTVLDVDPPKRPGADAVERLATRRTTPREALPSLVLRERGAVRDAELRLLAGGVPPGDPLVGGWWVDETLLTSATEHVRRTLDDSSGSVTLPAAREAIARAWRKARHPTDGDLIDAVIDELGRRGALERDGSLVRTPGSSVRADATAVEAIVGLVEAAGPTPPTLSELRRQAPDATAVEAALTAGALVRIGPDLVVTRAFVEHAIEVVRSAGTHGATVATVRQALGTSRKYAVPLMEHLDRTGQTRREGDLRFARGV